MTVQAYKRRFAELVEQLNEVQSTRRRVKGEFFDGDVVDEDLLLGWCVKTRNLLAMACGKDSEHYNQFLESEKPSPYVTSYEKVKSLGAVFLAAKEDYEGGYLRSVRKLVHAELFNDELEQANELLSSGYRVAAAVVAGVVLETTLRGLCADQRIAAGKMDKMNADLVKAGVYNVLVQKRITALADIRNKAAHGDHTAFNDEDVKEMIGQVERFVTDQT